VTNSAALEGPLRVLNWPNPLTQGVRGQDERRSCRKEEYQSKNWHAIIHQKLLHTAQLQRSPLNSNVTCGSVVGVEVCEMSGR
jgi:hypothetical protein